MKFTLNYRDDLNYDESVSIDIRFKKMPSEKDRKDLLDAIEKIKGVADFYMGETEE